MSDILEVVRKEQVKFIQLQFTDILGTVKNVAIPVKKLDKALADGIFFDGSSVLGYATIEESDMHLVPDPKTFLVLPWTTGSTKTARLVCDVYDARGKRFDGDPRHVLESVMNTAKRKGYIFNTGPEYEFFLFQQVDGSPSTVPSDYATYFDLMRDRGDEVRKEIVMYLGTMDFDVDASHHEVAPGQHEIDLSYSDAMTIADRVAMMKYVTKTISLRHDLYATFMPKPIVGVNGSGMHVHQSLLKANGENVFYDPKGEYELSDTMFYYIGGLLTYAKECCAILASWVNSYKRLVPGFEAPVYISWANRNRSALLRVPAGRGEGTRVELRNPDPAGNPYLQFAIMLGAGLEGIKRKLMPPEPVERDIYKLSAEERKALNIDSLPGNLGHALAMMEEGAVVKKILGEHLFRHFLHIKTCEWDEYRTQVTQWELDKVLSQV